MTFARCSVWVLAIVSLSAVLLTGCSAISLQRDPTHPAAATISSAPSPIEPSPSASDSYLVDTGPRAGAMGELTPASTAGASPVYTVAKGDTLSDISLRFGVNLWNLADPEGDVLIEKQGWDAGSLQPGEAVTFSPVRSCGSNCD